MQEVEQALLGALLVDESAFSSVSLVVSGECFTHPAHREIYETMAALRGRGKSIDIISVKAELARRGALAEVGGVAYVASLTGAVASAFHALHHAQLLREHWMRGRMAEIGGEMQGGGAGGDVFDEMDRAQSALSELAGNLPTSRPTRCDALVNDSVLLAKRLIQERAGGGTLGVSTGFPALDGRLRGMMGGELHVLAARPSVGKTVLALGLAVGAARAGRRVLFFSLEMSKAQLGLRLLALMGGVSHDRLIGAELTEEEVDAACRRAVPLASAPILFDDSGAIRIQELCAKARAVAMGDGGLGLIIVDYLQLVTVPALRGNVPREQVVAHISRALKALAKELNVPVLALAQLNRGIETRAERRPVLSDLRESGAIEQDADAVMMLHAPSRHGAAQYPDGSSTEGVVELLLLKNRKGRCGTVYLEFYGEEMRFAESKSQFDRYARVEYAELYKGGARRAAPAEARRARARHEEVMSAPPEFITMLTELDRQEAERQARGGGAGDEWLPF